MNMALFDNKETPFLDQKDLKTCNNQFINLLLFISALETF